MKINSPLPRQLEGGGISGVQLLLSRRMYMQTPNLGDLGFTSALLIKRKPASTPARPLHLVGD